MKILITDLHCASNRGDAAILLGLVAILKAQFPEAEISVLTGYPDAAELVCGLQAHRQKVIPIRLSSPKKSAALLYGLLCAFLWRYRCPLPGKARVWSRLGFTHYLDADLIVSTGGSHINDFYAPATFSRLSGLLFATLAGRPVLLLSQSLGPFNKTFLRLFTRVVLNRVAAITTRDPKSEVTLKEIGVDKPPVATTADAAFALSDTTSPGELRRAELLPIIQDAPLKVSISVRYWNHYDNPDGHRNYMDAMSALADWLIASKGAVVTFLSTCTGFATYHKDDRITANQVALRMRNKSSVNPLIVLNEYTPSELRDIYGKMHLHIGTRMHSNILAMLAGTPVVALQYEFKTSELMESMGLGDFVLDVNSLDFASLKSKVETALSKRPELLETVKRETGKLRAKAFSNGQIIARVMGGRSPGKSG